MAKSFKLDIDKKWSHAEFYYTGVVTYLDAEYPFLACITSENSIKSIYWSEGAPDVESLDEIEQEILESTY